MDINLKSFLLPLLITNGFSIKRYWGNFVRTPFYYEGKRVFLFRFQFEEMFNHHY